MYDPQHITISPNRETIDLFIPRHTPVSTKFWSGDISAKHRLHNLAGDAAKVQWCGILFSIVLDLCKTFCHVRRHRASQSDTIDVYQQHVHSLLVRLD